MKKEHGMKYNLIPGSNLNVSELCLGTMIFGGQVKELQAFEILDTAFEEGINFFDLAEMYPVPSNEYTWGDTEIIFGKWLKNRKVRDKVVIATKISGPGEFVSFIRCGKTRYVKSVLESALNESLRRIGTEYIDLYLLHWPERDVNLFGDREYKHSDAQFTGFLEILEGLQSLVQSGKVRNIGVSNETAWGLMKYISLSERYALPRISMVQNPYNLLNRSLEISISEVCLRENIGIMAYSPLAFGMLTGKHNLGTKPGSRLDLFKQMNRYSTKLGKAASNEYIKIATKHNISPAELAINFILQQKFITSVIIGASCVEQLQENISFSRKAISKTILHQIHEIQEKYPNPVS